MKNDLLKLKDIKQNCKTAAHNLPTVIRNLCNELGQRV